ncbi:unnamed protein product [Urochloa humidicola]
MEAALGHLLTNLGQFFGRLLIESRKHRRGLPEEIAFLKREQRELRRVTSTTDLNPLRGDQIGGGFLADLREIDGNISLCLCRYNKLALAPEDGQLGRHESSWARRLLRRAKTAGGRGSLAKDVEKTKRLLQQVAERWARFAPLASLVQPVCSLTPATFQADEAQPEGFDAPAAELIKLLALEGAAPKRMVAITGPPGSGKSRLTKVVFDGVREQFECSAWVQARGLEVEEILRIMLTQTGAEIQDNAGAELLHQQLRQHLQTKRYMIVIDEMQKNNWPFIQDALPDNNTKSRVLMIVADQGIVRSQCPRSCPVYMVKPLETEHSRKLLIRTAFGDDGRSPYLGNGLEKILEECGGLPLAIICMAQHLRRFPNLNETKCETICRNLGYTLFTDDAFSKMFIVLNRSYSSLPDLAKECSMSLSESLKDQVLERETFISKWVLGEAVNKCVGDNRPFEEIADEQFEKLVDHNIIQPVDKGTDGRVNTFRVQGMMFEYIRQKAVRDNYATFIRKDNNGDERLPESGATIHRLFYCTSIADDPGSTAFDSNLSQVRSATISGPAGRQLLRAVNKSENLQELCLVDCTDLSSVSLNFSKLTELRYLRANRCTKLPKKMIKKTVKLHRLAILDIRDTGVDTLPIHVTQHSNLAVIVGRFGVPCKRNKRKIRKLCKLYKKSKLQKIEGLYVDGSVVFMECLRHMPKLSGLKLYCRQDAENGDFRPESIASSLTACERIRSLSIDFSNVYPLDFLNVVKSGSFRLLVTLELRGQLSELPAFIPLLGRLSHLALSETNLCLASLLKLAQMPALSRLHVFEKNPSLYQQEEEFIIQGDQFPRLQHLSIAAPRMPKIVIQHGALPGLHTLELFCLLSGGISGIHHLTRLEEIVIDANASGETLRDLSQEANRHPIKLRLQRNLITSSSPGALEVDTAVLSS